MKHIGGLKTGNESHNVKIYWNPEGDVSLSKTTSQVAPPNNESGQLDVKKVAESAKGVLEQTKMAVGNLNQVFNPASKVIDKLGGEAYSNVIKAIHTPEAESLGFNNAHSEALDKSFKQLKEYFAKLSPQDVNDFNLIRGEALTTEGKLLQTEARKRLDASLQDPKLVDALKEGSDYIYKYAKDNDLSINYFEDYYYGAFKNPAKVTKYLEYIRNMERYTKEKTFHTIADAQAWGLELQDPNPITNLEQEMGAISQVVGLKNLREQQLKDGHNYAVEAHEATPEQLKKWDKIENPVFEGMLFDPEYAKFVNSLLSTNKVTSNMFLGGLRNTSYLIQQIKFFGSVFHLRNEVKGIISDESWGLFNKEGYQNLAKSFKPIDQSTPEYKEYVNLGGGHRYSIESQAQQLLNNFIDTFGKGNFFEPVTEKLKGVLNSKWIPASPGMVKWMFDEFIPSLKYTKYLEEVASQTTKLGRPLTDNEKIDIIKTNQNFYGEMNERLFGRSSTVTSALRIIFGTPGYGEGNARVAVKPIGDLAGVVKGEGFTPEGKRSIRFIISSLFTTLVTATIGTYIMTGKPPEKPETARDVRDLFKTQTNIKDGKGNPVYFDMMGYDNDFWSLYGNLATGQPEKILPTLASRVSGATSVPFRVLNDLTTLFNGGVVYDYKGTPVFYRTDSLAAKFSKFLEHEGSIAQPISKGTLDQSTQKGVGPVLATGLAVAGIRTTTSEKVKDTKAALLDETSLRNSKEETHYEISKLFYENEDAAIKQAHQFNISQIKKLADIAHKEGTSLYAVRQNLEKYVVDKVSAQKPAKGSSLDDRFKNEHREGKQIPFTPEQRQERRDLINRLLR